ncbi:MAG: hypothetical protein ACI9OJ_001390 [Myxococcota bacterium]
MPAIRLFARSCATRLILVFAAIVAIAACSQDVPSADPTNIVIESYLTVLPQHSREVDTWRKFCLDAGDPIGGFLPARPTYSVDWVRFSNATRALGLPDDVFSTALSAGRMGDRQSILMPGWIGRTESSAGKPYLELFVRCEDRLWPVGLAERADTAGLGTVTVSGLWDANGDGRTDIILGTQNGDGDTTDRSSVTSSVTAFYNDGVGGFERRELLTRTGVARLNSLSPIDINHDGVLDVYVALGTAFARIDGLEGQPADYTDALILVDSAGDPHTDLQLDGLIVGREPSTALVCSPAHPDGRGKVCWLGSENGRDRLIQEVDTLDFVSIKAPSALLGNRTVGVAAIDGANGDYTTFMAANIGRPAAANVDRRGVASASELLPMQKFDSLSAPTQGVDRVRLGWGIAAQYFSNTGCPGYVLTNALPSHLASLPIASGSGVTYYEQCDGGPIREQSEMAGPYFREHYNGYYQVVVAYLNGDLCPDLLLAPYPDEAGESPNSGAVVALLNTCDSDGRRLGVELVPHDYDARVVVEFADGGSLHGYQAPATHAGTNDPLITWGIGDRSPTRICVHWSHNHRWPEIGPDCIDNPSVTAINTFLRQPKQN